MESIGKRLQTLRRNKNITQAELAEVLSVSPQSVSKWENQLSSPDVSLLPTIARYFGITMDELFNYRLNALNYKERFIRFMVDNGVLQFGEFVLQSGRISPYYINTANYKTAGQIIKLGNFYAECFREHNVESNLLVGNTNNETAIVIATGITLYNRYGIDINYNINGSVGKPLDTNDRITLIKDTLTSGKTLIASLQKTEADIGKCVTDVIVSVNRMEKGENGFNSAAKYLEQNFGIRLHSIVDIDDIIIAIENGIIGTPELLKNMKLYREKHRGE